MFKRFHVVALGAACLLGAVLGCGGDSTPGVDNHPPIVSITGGPLEGTTASYTARIFWAGWDQDGTIDHFEYALDPPPELTLDEIMDPVGSGLTVTLDPGPSVRQDTLVVTKTLEGGSTISFRWVGTTEFSESFVFETPHADSSFTPGTGKWSPRPTHSGLHTVYLRGRDNEGKYSVYKGEEDLPPFRLAFNARTITPVAQIDSPNIEADLLTVGTTMTVKWSGADEDSPDPQGKPVGFLYKVLNLTELGFNCATEIDPSILYLYTNRNDPGWVYQDGDTLQHTFRLPLPKCFMLGIRAVDVAGGVEPFLELHRNVFKFRTVPQAGYPVLTINEGSLGAFRVTYPFEPVVQGRELQAAVGRPIRFFWNASGLLYGGEIDGYSWGVDVPDVGTDGPESGWSPWGAITSTPAITFRTPGTHVFYIRARDTAETINIAEITVRIVDFPLDREALYVDDYPDGTYPRAQEHDTFWLDLFANSSGRFQPGDVQQWDTFGALDTGQSPLVPTLERLGRYRLLVWSNNGGGFNGASGLIELASKTPVLGAYLRSGGKLWLSGVYTVAATTQATVSGIASFEYPKTPGPGEFVWDYLKVQSDRMDNDKGVNEENRFMRAVPADSLLGGPRIYEAMHVDYRKFSPRSANKSVAFVDATLDPIFAEVPGFRGNVDTLYVFGSAGRIALNRNSRFHNRICAVRWHDPDPSREHGRTQWFAFPMYYFKNDQAQDTFNRTVDWFREETINAP